MWNKWYFSHSVHWQHVLPFLFFLFSTQVRTFKWPTPFLVFPNEPSRLHVGKHPTHGPVHWPHFVQRPTLPVVAGLPVSLLHRALVCSVVVGVCDWFGPALRHDGASGPCLEIGAGIRVVFFVQRPLFNARAMDRGIGADDRHLLRLSVGVGPILERVGLQCIGHQRCVLRRSFRHRRSLVRWFPLQCQLVETSPIRGINHVRHSRHSSHSTSFDMVRSCSMWSVHGLPMVCHGLVGSVDFLSM